MISQWIEVEIDEGREDPLLRNKESSLRVLVLAACREVNPEWNASLPRPDCEDVDEWTLLLDRLTDRILWDRDFEEEELFLDTDPETTRYLKNQLGIVGDYFTAIASDPTDDQFTSIRETLRQLCARPEPRTGWPESGEGEDNPWF